MGIKKIGVSAFDYSEKCFGANELLVSQSGRFRMLLLLRAIYFLSETKAVR
jgi:hypothetical protein